MDERVLLMSGYYAIRIPGGERLLERPPAGQIAEGPNPGPFGFGSGNNPTFRVTNIDDSRYALQMGPNDPPLIYKYLESLQGLKIKSFERQFQGDDTGLRPTDGPIGEYVSMYPSSAPAVEPINPGIMLVSGYMACLQPDGRRILRKTTQDAIIPGPNPGPFGINVGSSSSIFRVTNINDRQYALQFSPDEAPLVIDYQENLNNAVIPSFEKPFTGDYTGLRLIGNNRGNHETLFPESPTLPNQTTPISQPSPVFSPNSSTPISQQSTDVYYMTSAPGGAVVDTTRGGSTAMPPGISPIAVAGAMVLLFLLGGDEGK